MELPKRKPTRLKTFDYSTDGYYFITICTKNKERILCDIVGEGLCALPKTKLTPIGEIVDSAICYINNNYDNVLVDKYVIMPNHIHLIVAIKTGGDGTPPLQLYDIIGRLKSFTTNQYKDKLWQRSFHDHIIRCEKDYKEIWGYISKSYFVQITHLLTL